MDLASFRALFSPQGLQALAQAAELQPDERRYLSHFQQLARHYLPELSHAALETAVLRREAAAKFPFAEKLFFTRPALEQASSYAVSTYRAGRLSQFERLVDLGCSVGGDTLALAQVAETIGVDLDLLRLEMARANLSALGLEDSAAFLQADLSAPLPLRNSLSGRGAAAVFFDPARRSNERRIYSVSEYQPPLDTIRTWLSDYPAQCVKISPGVDLDELRGYEAEVEFISLGGDLKEAALWFGPLKSAERRATLLPGAHTLTAGDQSPLPLDEPQAYLYEPDPAVLRAGLVATLGWQLGAAQLDPDIAYLTSGRCVDTPFARCWAVEDWLPFQLKRLRAWLHARQVGQLVVKKRGSPIQPEELVRRLKLKGDRQRVLFLTHLRGRPIVIIAHPPPV